MRKFESLTYEELQRLIEWSNLYTVYFKEEDGYILNKKLYKELKEELEIRG